MAGHPPSSPSRHSAEAALFITEALSRAASLHGKGPEAPNRHLSAQQLLDGVLDLAAERWGLLAGPVLRSLGIASGDDVGAITFQLIADGVFAKQPEDRIEDFHGSGPLDAALERRYRQRLGLDPDAGTHP